MHVCANYCTLVCVNYCIPVGANYSCGGRVFYDTPIPGDILIGGHQLGAALPTIT